jgi:hypothetical protein
MSCPSWVIVRRRDDVNVAEGFRAEVDDLVGGAWWDIESPTGGHGDGAVPGKACFPISLKDN